MFEIHRDTGSDGALVLHLSGAATVEQAEALRQALLETIEQAEQEHQPLRISSVQVTEIDSFILQMFCSAHRTAVARQVLMTWDGSPAAAVMEVIRATGFIRHAGCSLCPDDQHCLWCEK